MGNSPEQSTVFVIDGQSRVLTKDSLHRLLSELFEKALNKSNVDAVAVNGKSINICEYLLSQVKGKDVLEWHVIYLHDDDHAPVLLNNADKEKLVILLHDFKGISADAICKVLADA